MIRNYFKIAFRSFRRHKLFTFINVIGLSIGICAALVIYLIVHFDFTFDKFHKDSDRVYRVASNFTFQGDKSYNGGVCTPLTQVTGQVAGIELAVPIYTLGPDVSVPGKNNVPVKFKAQDKVALAGSGYFKMFNYKWLAGSAQQALVEPNTVVLTSEQAKKYFPGLAYNQMIGKTVTYDTLKTTVTGIVETITQNTDFAFKDLISYSTGTSKANSALYDQLQLDQWGSTNSSSMLFVRLSANARPVNVEKQFNDLLKKNDPPKPTDKGSSTSFALQPFSDFHFSENYSLFNFSERSADKTTLYYLLGIASFLLLLGCINFINLTTAQASQRAKEIGIRKTMGSNRQQLIVQFLSETFLITLMAVIISIALTPVALKIFSDFIPFGVKADFLQINIILFLIGLIAVVSFVSGFYPAILLSGYKPIMVLKNQSASRSSQTRNAWLRKSLTVTQFVIAQFFIMGTILVSKQIYYALHKDLGFKKEAIVIISSPYRSRTTANNTVLYNKMRAMPQIQNVSLGSNPPSSGNTNSTFILYKDGKKEVKTEVQLKYGDVDYVNIYQLKVIAGHSLLKGDTSKSLLVNETYAKVLGFRSPSEAIGKLLDFNGKQWQIAGVMHDFYQKSLRTAIEPLALMTPSKAFQSGTFHIALRPETPGGNEWKTTIAAIQKSFKAVYPDDDFEYHFFDENIKKFYDNEAHTSTLLSWATGLSILISCLGLLGLAIYTTNLRTKEIGVRKVLGASVTQIVTLLSTELVLLILLAFIIVTPVAWYAMNKWMQHFADKTTISWWIFVLSGAGMLVAAVITSSFQTVKAAITNPVKSLRSE